MTQTWKEAVKECLSDLNDEQLKIIDKLNDPETDPEVLKDTLEMVEADFLDGVDFFGRIYEYYSGEVKKLAEMIERLQARKKNLERAQSSIKGSMLHSMIIAGRTKAEGTYYAVSTRRSQRLEITGEVPEDFLRYKDPEPDKKAITDWIKNGHDCDFAHLEETTSLIVR